MAPPKFPQRPNASSTLAAGKATRTLAVLALALLAAAPAAQAALLTSYRNTPLEHDNMGSVAEPDGVATSALGMPIANRVLDLPPFHGRAFDPPPAATNPFATAPGFGVVAPGCSSDVDGQPQRQPGGLCAVWTIGVRPASQSGVPPGQVGTRGMSGILAPGAFTPTKASAVRFLDGQIVSSVFINNPLSFNQELRDTPLPQSSDLASTYGPGFFTVWAWYGEWRDLNGNGVVDAITPGTAGSTQNEFTWLGSCTDAAGARVVASIQLRVCAEDPNPNVVPAGVACADDASVVPCAGTTMALWIWPGNVHGGDPVTASGGSPIDLPGNQVVDFVGRGGNCQGPPTCDDDAQRDTAGMGNGDPLLDRQDAVAPDDLMIDRSGDRNDADRRWTGLREIEATGFDGGFVSDTLAVYGVNCAPDAVAPQKYRLDSCTFLDVDHHRALNPTLAQALTGGLSDPNGGAKGLARQAWLLVRDGGETAGASRQLDSVTAGKAVDDLRQAPLQGGLDDTLVSPGWSREPNHPEDVLPGVRYAPCGAMAQPSSLAAQQRGWCNVPAPGDAGCSGATVAYACHGGAIFRGFNDAKMVRSAAYTFPVCTPVRPCVFGKTGPLVDLPLDERMGPAPDVLPAADDPARSLPPGAYYLSGHLGRWRDGPHAHDETTVLGSPDAQTYPADGWVGFLARSTGQFRYRGFIDVACATERDAPSYQPSTRTAAECNPYRDGNLDDPQEYVLNDPLQAPDEEWQGACNPISFLALQVEPVGGTWHGDVLVWVKHDGGIGPVLEEDHRTLNNDAPFAEGGSLQRIPAGSTTAIQLHVACGPGFDGAWRSSDLVIFPQGNADAVRTLVRAVVDLGADVDNDQVTDADAVVDVDLYEPWAPLPSA